MLRAIVPSLARSRAIFVGARFMPDGFHGDGVVAIDRSPSDEPNDRGPLDASFHRVEPSECGALAYLIKAEFGSERLSAAWAAASVSEPGSSGARA